MHSVEEAATSLWVLGLTPAVFRAETPFQVAPGRILRAGSTFGIEIRSSGGCQQVMGSGYLLFCLAIPSAILLLDRLLRRSHTALRRGAILSFAIAYLAWVGAALFWDYWLELQLGQFDLDGDGIFSGSEVTSAQEEALRRVTSDTARTFAPLTGIGIAGLATAVPYGVVGLYSWVSRRLT